MDKFKEITIEGYRRLHDIQLEMRPLTVMIGANGSGKTSFLDAISILSASANGNLLKTLQKKGGLNDILTRERAKELTISVSMDIPNRQPLQYSLTLAPQNLSYEIKQETLTQKDILNFSESFNYIDSHQLNIKYFNINDRKWLQPNWDHNYLETSLSQVPKMYREPENFRKSIASCTYYGALDVSDRSPIRLPQTMRPASLPGAQGEDLVSCLYNLRETDSSSFEMLENMLSVAFPDFEKLNFPAVAAGTISMTWKDSTFPKPFYIHELSEGTLRFLWLVTLLQSQELTTITLLDEPEVSLHPELLQHLVYFLREASKRTQVIVATHSDRLVRFLDPKEILVCDIEEGEARMTWADTFDLEKWLEDYTLDQVWAMNLIGGRP